MPRARIQSGSESCAEIVTELATRIQDAAGHEHRRGREPVVGREREHGDRRPVMIDPAVATWSRVQRVRSRGSCVAITMAPSPCAREHRIGLAPPRPDRFATSGSSAKHAVECRKNDAIRTIAFFIRRDSRTYCQPSRIAPMKRSPGSTEGFTSRFQR
jgi:hypothetical protein